MTRSRKCIDCGSKTYGERCAKCVSEWRKKNAKKYTCSLCGKKRSKRSQSGMCLKCRIGKAERVFNEEGARVPRITKIPNYSGDWLVVTDPHIPFHCTKTLMSVVDSANMMNIEQLCVAGDLINADSISKFPKTGKSLSLYEEIVAAGRVVATLKTIFKKIVVIPGNHDQRMEKQLAASMSTPKGQQQLQNLASIPDCADPVSAPPNDVALAFFKHFFEDVDYLELPQMTINNHWYVQHPGTARKISPQLEREIAEQEHKSVIQGHDHLTGFGFEKSGKFVAASIGGCCDDEHFRYKRERPKPWPKKVNASCIIYQTKDNYEGRILPLVQHNRWFDLREVVERCALTLRKETT